MSAQECLFRELKVAAMRLSAARKVNAALEAETESLAAEVKAWRAEVARLRGLVEQACDDWSLYVREGGNDKDIVRIRKEAAGE